MKAMKILSFTTKATFCILFSLTIPRAFGLKVVTFHNSKRYQKRCTKRLWMKMNCEESPMKVMMEHPLRRRGVFQCAATIVSGSALGYSTPPLATAITISLGNGAMLPSEGEIKQAIPTSWEGVDNPFEGSSRTTTGLFSRLDDTPDSTFYAQPRIVEHIDETAVRTMTTYISDRLLRPNSTVLDLCSSWTSHFTTDVKRRLHLQQVVGLGMNAYELSKNAVLDSYIVQDLNLQPQLPFQNAAFDLVLCQLSIDYLTKPLDVMNEVGRVLKDGGVVAIFFSNRLFLQKVRYHGVLVNEFHESMVFNFVPFCREGTIL